MWEWAFISGRVLYEPHNLPSQSSLDASLQVPESDCLSLDLGSSFMGCDTLSKLCHFSGP